MKNLIMAFVATIFVVCNASAQDIIDPPKLQLNSNLQYLIQRQTTGFIKGWNWGGGLRMTQALKMNQKQTT